MMNKNIVILSKSQYIYSTEVLRKALVERNFNVEIINPLECDVIYDNDNSLILHKEKVLKNTNFVIPRIGAASDYYGINILEAFEKTGVKILNSTDSIKTSREKYNIYKILKDNQLPTPQTILVKSTENLELILEQLKGLPVIIKLSRGSQGKGIMIAESINSLKSILDSFLLLDEELILQEYIETTPKYSDTRVYVLNNNILGSTQRINTIDFRSNTHCGAIMQQIKIDQELINLSLKVAECFKLNFCSIDYLLKNNQPLILEINSTPGLEKVENQAKLNISQKIAEYIEAQLC